MTHILGNGNGKEPDNDNKVYLECAQTFLNKFKDSEPTVFQLASVFKFWFVTGFNECKEQLRQSLEQKAKENNIT